MEMKPGRVILEKGQIAERVGELAAEINGAYDGCPVTVVGVLDGCLVFLADLVRGLEMPVELALVRVKTYLDRDRPQQEPEITGENLRVVEGRRVLVVDDIYDSGATLSALREALLGAGAADVKLCALLVKEREHEREVELDFAGFEVEDVFVVGYGLDYGGRYRNLPYVAELEGVETDREIV